MQDPLGEENSMQDAGLPGGQPAQADWWEENIGYYTVLLGSFPGKAR